MAERQQARVQNAVEEMVQSLEREHIRKMQCLNYAKTGQERMFRCSAECCGDVGASMQQVHHCIERCHTPLAKAQGLVTSELEQFQDRLSRCTMHCSDKAKDLIDSGAKEVEVRSLIDNCVGNCVDEHIKLLPSLTRRLKDNLDAIPQ
ncbi:hypothetical protein DNTS_003615 [Danionella cerebrum]|uniref:Protein FAM136A n=1 Tax=Danionella cerebrum TaxID=2873325 RepID=A0A553NRG5_9TELE|nr:hypothetical protein DNTS_003615 [Danionella translucida]